MENSNFSLFWLALLHLCLGVGKQGVFSSHPMWRIVELSDRMFSVVVLVFSSAALLFTWFCLTLMSFDWCDGGWYRIAPEQALFDDAWAVFLFCSDPRRRPLLASILARNLELGRLANWCIFFIPVGDPDPLEDDCPPSSASSFLGSAFFNTFARVSSTVSFSRFAEFLGGFLVSL